MTDSNQPERLEAAALARSPGIVHGFFTRRGGVSKGIYASLNCGPGSDDLSENVRANRAAAMAVFGLQGADLVTLHQAHGREVLTLNNPLAVNARKAADGAVTNRPGLVLGVLTADCAPVLLADAEAGVIGAVHAGWRGALSGVIEATLQAMTGLGAQVERINAAIGPCISMASYEVDEGFALPFLDLNQRNARFFAPGARAGKLTFDLGGFVAQSLEQARVGRIERLEADTLADATRFFSYRRSLRAGETDYGRQLSAIALAPPPASQ